MSIPNPVPGGQFTDTFGACRGTNCSRRHMGIDIFAPKGSAIDAPIGGQVVKLGASGLGGNSVWVQGTDGRAYYFAHLDTIGVKLGQRVSAGTFLGTVGDTGDAKGGASHLHFSINGKVGAENPVVNPFLAIDRTLKFGPAYDSFGVQVPGGSGVQTANGQDIPQASNVTPPEGCLVKFPGIAGVGDFCLLSHAQARKVVGGFAILGGGIIMLAGVGLLAAWSLKGSPLAKAAGSVPGVGTITARVTPSGRAASAQATQLADTKDAETSARMAAAQNRQEAAESKMVRRRAGSTEGYGRAA